MFFRDEFELFIVFKSSLKIYFELKNINGRL